MQQRGKTQEIYQGSVTSAVCIFTDVYRVQFSRDKAWIGSVSHDSKIRFWHAEYLFEEDDDDNEEEGEEKEGGDTMEEAAASHKGVGGEWPAGGTKKGMFCCVRVSWPGGALGRGPRAFDRDMMEWKLSTSGLPLTRYRGLCRGVGELGGDRGLAQMGELEEIPFPFVTGKKALGLKASADIYFGSESRARLLHIRRYCNRNKLIGSLLHTLFSPFFSRRQG